MITNLTHAKIKTLRINKDKAVDFINVPALLLTDN
jgi:hypothetical protein